jgi:hypothetical protein
VSCGISTSEKISGARSHCGPVAAPHRKSSIGNTVFIDHMQASRNSELISGSAIEGDTHGQMELFKIALWAWRARWSLRYDRLRRLKRGDEFSIRYVRVSENDGASKKRAGRDGKH